MPALSRELIQEQMTQRPANLAQLAENHSEDSGRDSCCRVVRLLPTEQHKVQRHLWGDEQLELMAPGRLEPERDRVWCEGLLRRCPPSDHRVGGQRVGGRGAVSSSPKFRRP